MLQKVPNPTKHLVKALKKILKPVINLLIYKGITYPVLNEIIKELFVHIAENDFKLNNKQQTDSRINFLTGIHRKDVKRLKNQPINNEEEQTNVSLSALLFSRWLGDPAYSDKQGNPLALPRLMKQGGNQSFEGLVTSVNKDIRSRAILDEWLNMNIVSLDENDSVFLNKSAFVPQQGYQEKTWFFGENCHDHLAATVNNLKDDTQPFLERAVYYDQLTIESVKELAELSEKLGMKTLLEINSRALTLQNQDRQKQDAINRMRLGLYFYSQINDKSTNEKDQD